MRIKKPLTVCCFKCKEEFNIKWVISQRNYSQKNNWEYWTEKKEDEGKKICNKCLKDFYDDKWGNYSDWLNSKKKNLFRVYLATGKFN